MGTRASAMRALLIWTVGTLAAAGLVVAAVACGGSEPDSERTPPGTPVPATSSPTAVATATAAAATPEPSPNATATPEPPPATTTTPAPPPSETPSPTPPPTEAVATPEPPTAEPTPKPERSADARRGPETGRPESRSGKPEETPAASTGTVKYSKESEASGAGGSSGGQEYTWHDGDRVVSITLESGLVVQPSSQNTAADIVTRDDGESSIVEWQARHATSDTQPVFRSPSGQLMTLPGGVLLVLDDAWGQSRVNRFFSENSIASSDVERQDWAVNAFFIKTRPGMPSLDLANRLAALEGVEISSPNWQTEVSTR